MSGGPQISKFVRERQSSRMRPMCSALIHGKRSRHVCQFDAALARIHENFGGIVARAVSNRFAHAVRSCRSSWIRNASASSVVTARRFVKYVKKFTRTRSPRSVTCQRALRYAYAVRMMAACPHVPDRGSTSRFLLRLTLRSARLPRAPLTRLHARSLLATCYASSSTTPRQMQRATMPRLARERMPRTCAIVAHRSRSTHGQISTSKRLDLQAF